ncbi:MAG: ERAD-associated protein [Alectoria sarmentosa]|nr:MAG: ERAD-associated protein [Alectoria sarmentosa]
MSPIQPSKRRRLNAASDTLSQPFRSPFKTPLKPKPNAPSSSTKEALSSPTSSPPLEPNDPTPQSTSPPPAPHPTPTTTTPLSRTLRHQQHTPPSPEYLTLQKQHTQLLNRLSAARAALETSSQALKIESSTRDRELRLLIAKWRAASRAAAEEVFAGARDKVNRMGGVGAMRARERDRKALSYGWDDDPGSKGEHGDGEGEDADGAGFTGGEGGGGTAYARTDVDEVDEREEGARKAGSLRDGDGDEEEEEGYTMDLMLKSLNVELTVIGFDRTLQKWID